VSAEFSIRKLLEVVKGRPLMYLPSKSITGLSTFISGAYFAQRMILGEDAGFEEDELSKFEKKVVEKYSIESNHSWPSILLFHAGNEEQAFDKFFELWEELM
jgi:hypothetical protein